MIPKNIIQTYKTRDSIPERCQEYVRKLIDFHPGYSYMFFDDHAVEQFMWKKYPNLKPLYDGFEYNIQRIDLFRLLAVYEHGGFYFDVDVEITRPLDDLLDHMVVFPVEYDLEYVVTSLMRYRIPEIPKKIGIQTLSDQLGQYGFGSCPGHDFLEHYIHYIASSRIPECDIPAGNKEERVLCTTGPRLCTLAYMEYYKKEDLTLLRPRDFIHHRFGDYGIHHGIGSWK